MIPTPRQGGLLLVDKPAGVTSHAVAARVLHAFAADFPELRAKRRRGGGPADMRFRTGHAGTLDPLATGLLLVLLGRASRLTPFLVGLDKTYLATVRFGAATDTLDSDGEIVATAPPPADVADVLAILPRFTGPQLQVPPVYSALKRDGQSLHRLARAGGEVAEPDARPVTIHALRATGSRWAGERPELDLEVVCSSGTYVRSLARDLATAAGSLGHLSALRRVRVGPFDVAEAVTGVMEAAGRDLALRVTPCGRALPHLPVLRLETALAEAVRQGRQPEAAWFAGDEGGAGVWGTAGDAAGGPPGAAGESAAGGDATPVALLAPDGDLVAVAGRPAGGHWRLETVLPAIAPAEGDEPPCA